MIDRRTFLAGTGAVLLATPLAAGAQQAGKIARVGFLFFGVAQTLDEQEKGAAASPFWPAMKELGWVYGQNVVAERRYGESVDQLHTAAADLVRLKVDVVVVGTAGLAEIARLKTRAIPIVVSGAGADLVATGLVGSLARPGGNVTGFQVLSDELVGKRLELLKTLVPNLSRVAWLRDDITWSAAPQVGARYDQQAAAAARTLGRRGWARGMTGECGTGLGQWHPLSATLRPAWKEGSCWTRSACHTPPTPRARLVDGVLLSVAQGPCAVAALFLFSFADFGSRAFNTSTDRFCLLASMFAS